MDDKNPKESPNSLNRKKKHKQKRKRKKNATITRREIQTQRKLTNKKKRNVKDEQRK